MRFPIQQTHSPKKVGELKSDNNTDRKRLQYSIKIINIIITDNTRNFFHTSYVNSVLPVLTLLRQKTDFSDDDAKKFKLILMCFLRLGATLG